MKRYIFCNNGIYEYNTLARTVKDIRKNLYERQNICKRCDKSTDAHNNAFAALNILKILESVLGNQISSSASVF